VRQRLVEINKLSTNFQTALGTANKDAGRRRVSRRRSRT
jgi:hypothetical protein